MEKPKMSIQGFKSRLDMLVHGVKMDAAYEFKPYEVSTQHDIADLNNAFQKQQEYIQYLEKELEHLKQPFNLYCVTNGWKTYDGDCYASVIAHSEEEALKLCASEFKEHAELIGEDESFWNNLTVELVELDEDIKRDGISLGVTYD